MSDGIYLIWSNEHRAWWASGCYGYVAEVSHAGHFSRERALDICAAAIPGTAEKLGFLPEVPVRLTDAMALVVAYHTMRDAPRGAWE